MTRGRRRLLAFVLGVAVVVGIRLVAQHRRDDAMVQVRPAAVPSAAATVAPSVSPSPSGSAAPSAAESGPHEEADPVVAAEAWVQAWLNTSGGKAAWLARLQPITGAELYAGLTLTDVAQVPGGGKGVVKQGTRVAPIPGQADVTARVPSTVGAFDVTMTIRDERWLVTLNDQAR